MLRERWRKFLHFEQPQRTQSPVALEIANLRRLYPQFHLRQDQQAIDQMITYLEWVKARGLTSQSIVHSCYDLLYSHYPLTRTDEEALTISWNIIRQQKLSHPRPPRTVTMNLYPEYFRAILEGIKPLEGRAYDPASPKDYPDLRQGDQIIFSISTDEPNWQDKCRSLDLNPTLQMLCDIGAFHFSPLVHAMFDYFPDIGYQFHQFQPYLESIDPVSTGILRAAKYYEFPEYYHRIRNHGFLAIEVKNPRLLN